MGVQFDWQLEEDAEPEAPSGGSPRPWGRWLILLLVVSTIGGGGFYAYTNGREQIEEEEELRLGQIEEIVSGLSAVFEQDGVEAFLAETSQDEKWQAQQLHPENIAFWESELTVTGIERSGLELWANVQWETESREIRQRVMFFEERGEEVRLRDESRRFWGNPRREATDWGTIRYYALDEQWIDQLDRQVGDTLANHCTSLDCADVTVLLTDSWQQTAAQDTLRLPSPRVWGLGADGLPTASYWTYVAQQTAVLVGETTIRFAVPRAELSRYEGLVRNYTAENPRRQIELIPFDQLPEGAEEFLPLVDGAMHSPQLDLILRGEIVELTDFANSDTGFDEYDFYEQIWSAGWWNDRMWVLPHTADLPLIYYDRTAYSTSLSDRPEAGWLWDDLLTQTELFTDRGGFEVGIASYNRDLLYSYAFNQSNACVEEVTILCNPVLQAGDVAIALEFYKELHPYTTEIRDLTTFERRVLFQNQVSIAKSEAPMWVDSPAEYEQHFISRSALVAPFPGSDQFGGVTPLRVSSAVISRYSEQPRAVWEWLSFLSYQYPNKVARQIPARPSVARSVLYWDSLPRGLQSTMLGAFPNSRPILLEEQDLFNDDAITAVLEDSE